MGGGAWDPFAAFGAAAPGFGAAPLGGFFDPFYAPGATAGTRRRLAGPPSAGVGTGAGAGAGAAGTSEVGAGEEGRRRTRDPYVVVRLLIGMLSGAGGGTGAADAGGCTASPSHLPSAGHQPRLSAPPPPNLAEPTPHRGLCPAALPSLQGSSGWTRSIPCDFIEARRCRGTLSCTTATDVLQCTAAPCSCGIYRRNVQFPTRCTRSAPAAPAAVAPSVPALRLVPLVLRSPPAGPPSNLPPCLPACLPAQLSTCPPHAAARQGVCGARRHPGVSQERDPRRGARRQCTEVWAQPAGGWVAPPQAGRAGGQRAGQVPRQQGVCGTSVRAARRGGSVAAAWEPGAKRGAGPHARLAAARAGWEAGGCDQPCLPPSPPRRARERGRGGGRHLPSRRKGECCHLAAGANTGQLLGQGHRAGPATAWQATA